MHLSKALTIILPALAHAMPEQDAARFVVSTMAELRAIYPNVVIHDILDSPSFNNTYHVDATERRLGYKMFAGSLAVAGHVAILNGCEQTITTIDSCYDDMQPGYHCYIRGLSTATALALSFGAGFVGGQQFVQYCWHGGALQAAGFPPANNGGGAGRARRKRACNTDQKPIESPVHYGGQNGVKIAAKDMHCFSPDSGEMGYVASLGSMVASRVNDLNHNGTCTASTQFTIYETSTNTVLARYHLEIDTVRTDVCLFEITGGDSCIESLRATQQGWVKAGQGGQRSEDLHLRSVQHDEAQQNERFRCLSRQARK